MYKILQFPFIFLGKSKIYCAKCQKKCSGEVLRVTDKYFHKSCFQCVKCSKSLAAGGFFSKDGNYYCTIDYQKLYGTKCAVCNLYVEGEVVSTMGNTYHQKCFTCTKCVQPFESGSKVSIDLFSKREAINCYGDFWLFSLLHFPINSLYFEFLEFLLAVKTISPR